MSTENAAANNRRSIMIVDDEEINRELLGGILSLDYDIVFAENGGEAYDMLRADSRLVSLILLDLVMPVMNGFELIEKLKASANLRRIPIIVLTSDRSAEVRSLELGAVDFIPKPYDLPDVIRARVKRTINLFEDRSVSNVPDHDELTGLLTKRSARALTDTHLKEGGSGVFFVIDLDNFKSVNDTYGHLYGDEVLIKVADCIKRNSRGIDIPARFGGDEFTVFYPDMDLTEAEKVAGDMLASLKESFSHEKMQITCSIGISAADPSKDYNVLFEETDQAMYESKKSGKNRYTVRK